MTFISTRYPYCYHESFNTGHEFLFMHMCPSKFARRSLFSVTGVFKNQSFVLQRVHAEVCCIYFQTLPAHRSFVLTMKLREAFSTLVSISGAVCNDCLLLINNTECAVVVFFIYYLNEAVSFCIKVI